MDLQFAAAYCREIDGDRVTFASEWAIDSWQVSHVWCVQDPVGSSRNMEAFLAKAYRRHPYSTCYQGQRPWEQRIDMPDWLTKLVVASATRATLQEAVASALRLSDDAEDPDLGRAFRSCMSTVEIPAHGWILTEVEMPRNPVGGTDIVLFQSGPHYVFLETHRES